MRTHSDKQAKGDNVYLLHFSKQTNEKTINSQKLQENIYIATYPRHLLGTCTCRRHSPVGGPLQLDPLGSPASKIGGFGPVYPTYHHTHIRLYTKSHKNEDNMYVHCYTQSITTNGSALSCSQLRGLGGKW